MFLAVIKISMLILINIFSFSFSLIYKRIINKRDRFYINRSLILFNYAKQKLRDALGDTSSKMTFDLNNLKALDDGILSDTSYGLKILERKGQGGYHWPDYQERTDKFFVPKINKTPIEYMSDVPLWLSLEQKVKELSTIGKGRTYVSGGGGNYSLGTGDAHWCSVYDYHNGKLRFANPNATGDYQDVPISDFVDKYLGIGAFHNH